MSGTSATRPLHVVGSASIWVLGQVAGPAREARVVHAGRDAVYLELNGLCLGVLGARAVQVPCGVRTTLPGLRAVEPGAPATVVDGTVQIPGCEVLVTNIVDTTVPVLADDVAERGGAHLEEAVGDRLDLVRKELPDDAVSRLAAGDPAAVDSLIGLGPGLTPLGDDVLAGWLAAAVARRHPALADLRSSVALSAAERTSTLSATLLACAARGEGLPEFRSLLTGVASENPAVVDQSLDLLLRIGDTSGAGLVLGALLALRPTLPRTP